jgi:Ala-tRNA(Pro) deacylase
VVEPTYYVQFHDPEEEPERWHTIARVQGRGPADEVVRLAEGGYMRASVTAHYEARALSRSALKRAGQLAHAEWELGMGPHRQYGRALVEKAEQNLRRAAPAPPPATAGERVAAVLEQAGAAYELLPHAHTESAVAEAAALGVSPAAVGKTLLLSTPEGYVRAVLPASDRLDLRKVRGVVNGGKHDVRLASEDDLRRDFGEFEVGAVPPFGGAGSDRVLLDQRLAARESVVVEAGSHDESLRLKTDDLIRLTGAQVADICQEWPGLREEEG